MKRKLITYYLPWLATIILIIVVTFLMQILTSDEIHYKWIFPEGILIIVLFTLSCGGIYQFYFEYLYPRRIKKIIRKAKLKYLLDMGFEFDGENDMYAGYFRSFYVCISGDSDVNQADSITIAVFIAPTENQKQAIIDLNKKYKVNFTDVFCSVSDSIPFAPQVPKRTKLESALNKLIDNLLLWNIRPSEIVDYE